MLGLPADSDPGCRDGADVKADAAAPRLWSRAVSCSVGMVMFPALGPAPASPGMAVEVELGYQCPHCHS